MSENEKMIARVTEQAQATIGRELEKFEKALIEYAINSTFNILTFERKLTYKETN